MAQKVVAMCPAPRDTEWEKQGNPHMHHIKAQLEKRGWQVKPLTREDLEEPESALNGVDLLYLHWASSAYHIEQYQTPGLAPSLTGPLVKIPCSRRFYKYFLALRHRILNMSCADQIVKAAEADLESWTGRIGAAGVPVVWHQHDLLNHDLKGRNNYMARIDLILHQALYDLSAGIVVHEKSCLAPVFSLFGGEKPYALGYLGQLQELLTVNKKEARSTWEVGEGETLFLYNGTARPNRNPRRIIQAFNALSFRLPGCRLIVASRNCRKYLRGVDTSRVDIHSWFLKPEQLGELYSACDFVITESDEYLTSAVIRTAMAYGKPVVASLFGATADMARDAIIPLENSSEDTICRAMEKAAQLEPGEYALMERAAQRNHGERSWDRCGENLAVFFEELVNNSE